MVLVANELRKKHGNSYIVEQLFTEAQKLNKNTIIENIRNIGEIEGLRKMGKFILFAVDAKPEIRYQRIIKRKSETDNVSYEKFLSDEKKEMNSKDSHSQNIFACIKQADYHLKNNGSFEDLYKQINKIFEDL